MTPPPPDPTAAASELLAQSAWIHALARRLVADAHGAEDLAQETWRVALERAPAGEGSLRAWLATVMRNLVRQDVRGRSRRESREERVARPEPVEATDELVERVTTQRALVEAVLELEEPYRSTVLLRFFEGLAPRHVAQRMGVPVSTVKTRLARALARLRERLDREHGGDGRQWAVALLPLAARDASLASPLGPLGTLAMNAKTKIALTLSAGVVVVLGSRALLPAAEPSAAEPGSSQTELLAAEVPDVEEAEPLPFEASTPEEAANPQRVPLAPRESPEAESATVEPEPETEPSLLAGIVIDVDGQPIAGVPLHLGPYGVEPNPDDEPAAWTDRAGRFELATRASPRSRLRVAGESWATLIGSRAVPDTELVLVVAPRIDLEGKVVDEEDRPVADARVEVHLPEDLRSRLGRVLDESYNVRFAATTDAAGSFALDAVAWTAGAELLAARTGFQRAAQPLPRYPDARLRLVLARPPGGPGAIEGRVVDGEDLPIEGALVALGLDLTQTDSEGLFSLPLNDPEGATARFSRFAPIERDRLTAVSPGYAPGVLLPSVDGNGEPHWPGFVTLRLDLPSLSISGQVVDEAGSPLPEAVVWVADPTTLGGDDGGLILIEHYLGERNQSRWSPVPVDERGRFEIAGLADRKYTVQAWHEESLTFSVEARAHAGTEHLTVVVPLESERWARLEGRVVDLSGRPVEGVSVRLMADAFRMRHSGTTLSTTHVTGEPLLTTADGRFEWNDVAKGSLYVRVDGNDIEPIEYGRGVDGGLATLADESGDVARLEIPVFRRCHIQVLRPASLDVDGIGALDAEGNALTLSIWAGGSRRDGPRVPFRGEERSEVIAVPETARTILLVNEGEEVARLPVEPTPGEVVVLEP